VDEDGHETPPDHASTVEADYGIDPRNSAVGSLRFERNAA